MSGLVQKWFDVAVNSRDIENLGEEEREAKMEESKRLQDECLQGMSDDEFDELMARLKNAPAQAKIRLEEKRKIYKTEKRFYEINPNIKQ